MSENTTHHVPSVCGGSKGRGPAFGRIKPGMGCARCDELAAEAPTREAAYRRRTDDDKQIRTYYQAHRASCVACQTGRGVCTYGDW